MTKEGTYKNNRYSLVCTNDGRGSFIVNGSVRFFGAAKAAAYFFELAENNPTAISW